MKGVDVGVTMTLEGEGALDCETIAESLRMIKPGELAFERLSQENGRYRAVLTYRKTHLI